MPFSKRQYVKRALSGNGLSSKPRINYTNIKIKLTHLAKFI